MNTYSELTKLRTYPITVEWVSCSSFRLKKKNCFWLVENRAWEVDTGQKGPSSPNWDSAAFGGSLTGNHKASSGAIASEHLLTPDTKPYYALHVSFLHKGKQKKRKNRERHPQFQEIKHSENHLRSVDGTRWTLHPSRVSRWAFRARSIG